MRMIPCGVWQDVIVELAARTSGRVSYRARAVALCYSQDVVRDVYYCCTHSRKVKIHVLIAAVPRLTCGCGLSADCQEAGADM